VTVAELSADSGAARAGAAGINNADAASRKSADTSQSCAQQAFRTPVGKIIKPARSICWQHTKYLPS
jgi:hypothetical protein